jgi:CHAT domain-containing protein
VMDIAALNLDSADLAFLSACQTALGGASLPDESITLASGFQIAGFRHVIATLWPMSDQDGPTVVRGVYSGLLASHGLDAQHSARALHDAVLGLRRQCPDEPHRWAPFVHVGL